MIPVYVAAFVVMLACPAALGASYTQRPDPRHRMAEPRLSARLKRRLRRRVAWFVLAQTLRYRLTVQFGG